MCQVVKLIRNRKSRKRYILYAKSCTSSLYVCSLRALHSRKRFACFKLLQGTPLSLGQQEELLTWVETNFYYFAHIVRRHHHQHHEALTNTSSASVRLYTDANLIYPTSNKTVTTKMNGLELILLYFFGLTVFCIFRHLILLTLLHSIQKSENLLQEHYLKVSTFL